jgi:hypothetical protein
MGENNQALAERAQARMLQIDALRSRVKRSALSLAERHRTMKRLDELYTEMAMIVERFGSNNGNKINTIKH